MTETPQMETFRIPGTGLAPSRIGLGTWAIGGWHMGRDRRGRIDPHHSCRARSRHHADRYRAGLWLWPFRGDRRQGLGRRRPSRGRRAGHQGRARLEERAAVPQWQPRPHHERDRQFAPAPANRRDRPLSNPLARSEHGDRGNRRRHGRAVATPAKSGRSASAIFSPAQMDAFRAVAPLHAVQPPYNLFERAHRGGCVSLCEPSRPGDARLRRALSRPAVRPHAFQIPAFPTMICAAMLIRNLSRRYFAEYLAAVTALDRFAQEQFRQARDSSGAALGARSRSQHDRALGRSPSRSTRSGARCSGLEDRCRRDGGDRSHRRAACAHADRAGLHGAAGAGGCVIVRPDERCAAPRWSRASVA